MSRGMSFQEFGNLLKYIIQNNSPFVVKYPKPSIKYVDPHFDMRTNTVFSVTLRGFGNMDKTFHIMNEFRDVPATLEERIREYLDNPVPKEEFPTPNNVGEFDVYHKGQLVYSLNSNLAARQKVSRPALEELIVLHQAKLDLFDIVESLNPKVDTKQMFDATLKLQQLEFRMQELWNFPQDASFHEWYLIPHCTCSTNQCKGSMTRCIEVDCPVHGQAAQIANFGGNNEHLLEN